MTALLLAILLVVMLLVMYLVNIPEDELIDDEPGMTVGQYNYPGQDGTDKGFRTDYEDGYEGESGIGGDRNRDGGGGYGAPENPNIDPDPGFGDGIEGNKSAVQVQIIDEETGNTVKIPGVGFELYYRDSLRVLCTYYPTRVEYRRYETRADGTFYLPEKIEMEIPFSLHPVTAIEGYDLPERTDFTVTQSRDWDDPYIVLITLSPEKNVIRVHLVDNETNKAITDTTFQVVAAANITTKDGTVRHKAGEIVDSFTLDENGEGQSRELYLGSYHLEQTQVAEHYAKLIDLPMVALQKKSGGKQSTESLQEEKTAILLHLTDALYVTSGVEDAEFQVTENGSKTKTYRTNEQGILKLDGLSKNTTYRIQQKSAPGQYRFEPYTNSFTVDGDGLIDGAPVGELELTNRLIRISVDVVDRIFRGEVSDVNIGLRNRDGQVIQTWNTSGIEKILEGIEPGEYEVVLNGNERTVSRITVEDTGEMQPFHYTIWTVEDIGFVVGASVVGIGLVLLIGFFLKQRKRKKELGEEG